MNRVDGWALLLLLPAAALALPQDGTWAARFAQAALALTAGLVAWRCWSAPHPWTATVLVALGPPLPAADAVAAAAALAAWAAAPGLGLLLAFPFAAQALGHGAPAWTIVLMVAAAATGVPALARRSASRAAAPAGPWARMQPLAFIGAALFLPAVTGGLHAAYAWAAFAMLFAVQGWAVLLAWQARASHALAGPLAAVAALAAAAGVRLAGLGAADPFLLLAVVLAAPALPSVLALATRGLAPPWRGPAQATVALAAALALRGLPV